MGCDRILSIEDLERLRDTTYHRTPVLRIRTVEEAAEFIDQSGMAFAFKAMNSELPCLWHAACGERNPVLPEHTHHDPAIGLVWEVKDILPLTKRIYYGKALRKTPTMISLELFPSFYATKGYGDEEETMYHSFRQKLSRSAYRILDVLRSSPPLPTRELKIASGNSGPEKRYQFDRAMAELQELLLIVKIEETSDPFSFVWGRLDRWLVREVQLARNISREAGRFKVLEKYFSRVVTSTPEQIRRLFKWNIKEIETALGSLLQKEIISNRIRILDAPGTWYIHSRFFSLPAR